MFLCNLQIFLLFLIEFPKFFVSFLYKTKMISLAQGN